MLAVSQRRGLGAGSPRGSGGSTGASTRPSSVIKAATQVTSTNPVPATQTVNSSTFGQNGGQQYTPVSGQTVVYNGCPIVNLGANDCSLDGGMTVTPCDDIRECDPLTGVVHYEFGLPGGTGNANIRTINGGMIPTGFDHTPTPSDPSYGVSIAPGCNLPGVPCSFVGQKAVNGAAANLVNTNSGGSGSVNATAQYGSTSQNVSANNSSVNTQSVNASQGVNSYSSNPASVGTNLLTNDGIIAGIPNWALLLGAGVLLFGFMKR